ncbi:ABC transporter substrate-binding protein [uncultured Polaribacter sp.]|uniref:ABC transporter substrate-binding protein n=1 Tax=uncultured Polaribacter sp. TaxID=174711 RepID=UPI00260376F8|nr:ABC transporter substrate-binding protein [uncultured Polaribacter sp.]
MKIYPILFFFTFLLFSCKNEKSTEIHLKNSKTIKYAKGFDIVKEEKITKLIIKKPYQKAKKEYTFILGNVTNLAENKLKTPVKSLVATSTTHIPMLELLNAENAIVGFPQTQFISSKKTRKRIALGKIKELGTAQSINTEKLIELSPDVIVAFSLEGSNKSFKTILKSKIPVIYNGDWLEETPLGKAEWIKFFGALLNKEKEADSIFKAIEQRYLATKELALKAKDKPTVLSGNLFSDVWYAPGGKSFIATYFKDANTNYLWKNSKKTGSLPLSIETVLDKAQNATYWIGCGLYKTKKEMENSSEQYQNFNAFKNNKVYTYANKKGATGGLIYFETSAIKPDALLKDILKITHPELLPNYQLTFFDKIK